MHRARRPLYERRPTTTASGYNTAICVAPDGTLLARTRKMHLPVTAGYYEDTYFRVGDTGYPVVDVAGTPRRLPDVLGRVVPRSGARSTRSQGAEVIVYPTAIGSEPDHPGFDTEPLWEQVIRANGIANGTFMVVPNRIGTEGPVTFYGSSFISDPYGRVLVQAPRDEARGARRRSRPRPAPRLARPVPVPPHPTAVDVRTFTRRRPRYEE